MARAIDIQPIIEEIQSSLEIPSYSEHDKGFDDGLKYVLDLIENAPTITPPNEWVRVEKGLPEPGERVLAANGSFVGESYMASNGAWMRHDGFPWEVDAWMPMPDRRPPEGEEDT